MGRQEYRERQRPEDFPHTGKIGVDKRKSVSLSLDEDESESLKPLVVKTQASLRPAGVLGGGTSRGCGRSELRRLRGWPWLAGRGYGRG